jgi:hypothetical protein
MAAALNAAKDDPILGVGESAGPEIETDESRAARCDARRAVRRQVG